MKGLQQPDKEEEDSTRLYSRLSTNALIYNQYTILPMTSSKLVERIFSPCSPFHLAEGLFINRLDHHQRSIHGHNRMKK